MAVAAAAEASSARVDVASAGAFRKFEKVSGIPV